MDLHTQHPLSNCPKLSENLFFSQGMEAIQLDGDILFGLLKKTSPAIHKHLKDQDVMPILYMQVLLRSSTLKIIIIKLDLLGVVPLHLCPHPPLAVCSQGDYHDGGSVIMLLPMTIMVTMVMVMDLRR